MMKSLSEYLKECGEGAAIPGNTTGAGNPMAPDGDQPGSGDIPNATAKPRRRRKKDVKIRDGREREYFKVGGIGEGLMSSDNMTIDINKTWNQFKKEFSQKIGLGLTNADVKFFENGLEFIRDYCKEHRSSTYAQSYAVYVNIPDKCLEISGFRTGGSNLMTYSWRVVGNKIEYGCRIDYYTGTNKLKEMQKSPNYIFVKHSVLKGMIR